MLVRRTMGASSPAREVYPPREDSTLLLQFAPARPQERVLEIGCGSGDAALTAARSGARVVATDLNPYALRALQRRATSEGLNLSVVRTDLARGLGRFDRILANPPYLPTARGQGDRDRWHDLALNGGPDGTRVTRRIVALLPRHLAVGGKAFLLVSSVQAAASLRAVRRRWETRGGAVRTVAQRRLEGETIAVWEFTRRRPTRPAPRASAPHRRSGTHHRAPRRSLPASSRGLARGRTRVPGAA